MTNGCYGNGKDRDRNQWLTDLFCDWLATNINGLLGSTDYRLAIATVWMDGWKNDMTLQLVMNSKWQTINTFPAYNPSILFNHPTLRPVSLLWTSKLHYFPQKILLLHLLGVSSLEIQWHNMADDYYPHVIHLMVNPCVLFMFTMRLTKQLLGAKWPRNSLP